MKHPKMTANYEFEFVNDRLIISPVRYKSVNKPTQINLTRILGKCQDSLFPKRQTHIQTPEQLMIVGSVQNQQNSQMIDNQSHRKITEVKHKLQFNKKRSSFKKTIEEQKNNEEIQSESGQYSLDKNKNAFKSQMLEASQHNFQPFVQIYISEKKMHESSFSAQERKKSYFQQKNISNKVNITPTLKPKAKPIKKMLLPDIKPSKAEPFKTKVPLLVRDPEQLKYIRSESYVVLQYPDNSLVLNYRGNNSYEIASLTKIMTFHCIQKIASKHKINISEEKTVVSDHIMNIGGTSAELIGGQTYTIEQLLYGLMLPSGNDAATCLAEWAGTFLTSQDDQKVKTKAFVNEMNKAAKDLELGGTRFGNPHGLPHSESHSTGVEVAKLCSICLNDPLFQKIVGTKSYSCSVPTFKETKRTVTWQNTNKLLRRQGFLGIKTGITVTAGPCLASAYKFRDKIYIVVVLRANKISRRFKETRKLLCWTIQKLYKNNLSVDETKILSNLRRNKVDLDSDYSEDEKQFNYDSSGKAEWKKRRNIINYQM